jgi:hypothetical protein
MIASFGWSDLAYLALSVFLLVAAGALAYAAVRLGGTLGRASSLMSGAERELLPVISRLGGTVDRVNVQLDKVDQVTDSAVDAVGGIDSAIRGIVGLVTWPVAKLAGLVAGVRHAASAMRTEGDPRAAVRTGRDEAARRERDLADDLEQAS